MDPAGVDRAEEVPGQAEREEVDREAADDLVGAQVDGEDGVDEREQAAEEHRHEQADDPRAAPDRAPDAEEGAHEHHPLEPDVHDAGALGEDPADRGERERRGEAKRRGEHARGEDAVEGLGVLRLEPDGADRAQRCRARSPTSRACFSPRGTAAIPQASAMKPAAMGQPIPRVVQGGSASQNARTPNAIPRMAIVRGS